MEHSIVYIIIAMYIVNSVLVALWAKRYQGNSFASTLVLASGASLLSYLIFVSLLSWELFIALCLAISIAGMAYLHSSLTTWARQQHATRVTDEDYWPLP
jgi:hypothetical protein